MKYVWDTEMIGGHAPYCAHPSHPPAELDQWRMLLGEG